MIEYRTHFLPTDFIIIGCGGTGSRLVPLVSQFLAATTSLPFKRLVLVDFDVVEEKNLERQNFTRSDIGVNKAEALGRRYGRHYGLEYAVLTERLSLGNMQSLNLNSAVVFCCVDSMDARREILWHLNQYFTNGRNLHKMQKDVFFIDAGNEDTFGQVKVSTLSYVHRQPESEVKDLIQKIPLIVKEPYVLSQIPLDEHFYMIPNSEVKTSCAERDQTLAINTLMAATQFGLFQDFIYHRPITVLEVRCTTQGGSWTHMNLNNLFELSKGSKMNLRGLTSTSAVRKSFKPEDFEMTVDSNKRVALTDIAGTLIKDNPIPKPVKPKKVVVEQAPDILAEPTTPAPAPAPAPEPVLTAAMLEAAISGARRI